MADQKLSELVELAATPAVDDEVYIRDVSEAAADESKRITIANLTAAGVSARAYQANAQTLDNGDWRAVMLDTEDWDTGGDMDVTVRTGVADATEANKLHDADGGFEAGDVGATVWNTTDNTYAIVSAFVDSGELTLDTDIMVDTEGYKLFRSWFVCPADGKYIVTITSRFESLADAVPWGIGIYKNGSFTVALYALTTGAANYAATSLSDIIDASANDKIQSIVLQISGGVEPMAPGTGSTCLASHRLS